MEGDKAGVRGEERLVLCCGDGSIVDVGEGNGDGVRGNRGKELQLWADSVLGVNMQMCQKGSFHMCSVR